MNPFFDIDPRLQALSDQAREDCRAAFAEIERTTEYNQQKMLAAFIRHGVSESHLVASTGYGYGDRGRDTLDGVMADVMGAEDALIRQQFVSGTHALTVALFGVLRPGDRVVCVSGTPYDTIHSVFGIRPASGSLQEFGVTYSQVELTSEGRLDHAAIEAFLRANPVKMVYLQRSRGYDIRPSFLVEEIGEVARLAHAIQPQAVVMVDNCYGEFVQRQEPPEVGADLIAGSLIKNPGGGIAPTGGYIAGRADLVEQCAYRMTTPGTGRELGATLGHNRELFMGLFHAPHVVGEALKTAVYTTALLEKLGVAVTPGAGEKRADIIQTVTLGTAEGLISFCRGMQRGAPVDAFVRPEPSPMPGYDDPVIMAAGAFTLGSSIELSADGPLRPPYCAWMQGGLHFHSAGMGVLLAAQSMLEDGSLSLK